MDDKYYKGILKRWDDQRGFGFIVAEHGEVFFHISALKKAAQGESARDQGEQRPREGDVLHYQIQPGSEDKPRAANVRVENRNPSRPIRAGAWRSQDGEKPRWPGQVAFFVLLLGGIGVWGYLDRASSVDRATSVAPVTSNSPIAANTSPAVAPARPLAVSSRYSCDGRVYCSEMTSCAEAKYFIRNCPGTKMGGNRDGVPCERQWCGH